jgi:DNA-binding transcriptional LysR family regulator
MQDSPSGALRISLPMSFGVSHGAEAVTAFIRSFPDVSVDMVLDDRFVELISEGFDVAIRIGNLEDSSLRARKFAETRLQMVCSQSYIERYGQPTGIDDLSNHKLLHYSQLSTGNFWRITNAAGIERQIRVGGPMTANNGDALLQAALAGLGIVSSPSFLSQQFLRDGRLVEIMPDLSGTRLGIHAIYPEGKYTQPKLRAFIDFMVVYFKGKGADDW